MPNFTLPRSDAHAPRTSQTLYVGPRRAPTPVAARRRARALATGRRRAVQRLSARTYAPHPGWRNFLEPGVRVVESQREALHLVDKLIDDEDWRGDKRTAWTAILHQLVRSMDWTTGLVTAVTVARLGEAGGRASRTVSRVLAWARHAGLLAVVEAGASPQFLGSDRGRTPTYALVTRRPREPLTPARRVPVEVAVEETGDLPNVWVDQNPLNGGRLEHHSRPTPDWPLFRIPQSPSERNQATHYLLRRLGLDAAGVSGVPLWRARALLHRWWQAGASPAGVLHAIERHPDHPRQRRGDALRGARDPLRVLGHRLAPWQGRLNELPSAVLGVRGDYLAAQRASLTQRIHDAAICAADQAFLPASSTAARDRARRNLAEHLSQLRSGRTPRRRPVPGSTESQRRG